MSTAIIKASSPALARRTTPGEAAQQVLTTWFDRYSPRTVEVYRNALEAFARWVARNGDLDGTPSAAHATSWLFSLPSPEAHVHVQAFLKFLKDRGLAPNSIGIHLSALRSLVKLGRVLGAVTWTLEVRGPKMQNVRDTRGPGLDDAKKLIEHTKRRAEDHALVWLMLERGLRGIEVRELQLKHLRLSDRPPSIMVRGKGQSGLTPVEVSAQTRAAVEDWLQVRHARVGGDLDGFLFFKRTNSHAQLSKSALTNRIARIGRAAGVRVWPHGLRHTAITLALDSTGGDVRAVRKFSRHAHIETVIRYDDQRRDVGTEVARKVVDALGGKR